MPHIVIEHSKNISEQVKSKQILSLIHKKVVGSGLFRPEAVKARSIEFTEYCLPEGANNFIHITVSILSGRSIEERSNLSQKLFKELEAHLPEIDKKSVNIHEMEKETYSK